MKVAVFSDIHGNIQALESVLDAVTKESPDRLLCLGDVAATGPNPHEVVERLRGLGATCIMGNTDESLLTTDEYAGDDPSMKVISAADAWCSAKLTSSDREFMRTFAHTARLQLGGADALLAFHGSPRSSSEWIPATATEAQLEDVFSGFSATILLGGHSHRQLYRRWLASSLVNPGSVGLAFQRVSVGGAVSLPDWAEFAVVTASTGGLEVSLRRVLFDSQGYRKSLASSGIPGGEGVLTALSSHMKLLLESGRIA